MTNPETPNGRSDTQGNAGSQGRAGDLSRGDPDQKAAFNGSSGGGQDGGGAYPNPHSDKEGGGKDGYMGHGGQTDMAYHGSGQLGEQAVGGGNANSPAGKAGSDDEKD